MFRLPFKGLWSSNNIKKLNVIKILKKFLFKFEILNKNHPPTRHIKYKVVDFAPIKKSGIKASLNQFGTISKTD